MLFWNNLVTYKELLFSLTISNLKSRYKQTFLGPVWTLVQPVIITLSAFFIFRHVFNFTTDIPYVLIALTGFVPWILFSNSLSFAIPNLTQNSSLLRKIYFPREILIVSAIIPHILDFLISLLFLMFFILVYKIKFTFHLIYLPFLLAIELIFILGLSLAGSIINIAFRDVSKLLPIFLQVLLFLTPVFYLSESLINPAANILNTLNPLAVIIEGYRNILLHHTNPNFISIIIAFGISLLTFAVGFYIFKKGENIIADII